MFNYISGVLGLRSNKIQPTNFMSLKVHPTFFKKNVKDPATPSSVTSSETSDSSDSQQEELAPVMKTIQALRHIADYFFFLDVMPSLDENNEENEKDEAAYRHNKRIIVEMITLSKGLLYMPHARNFQALEHYVKKLTKYDAVINKKQTEFKPKKVNPYDQMLPKIRGGKSEALAYLYWQYLQCVDSGNEIIDILRQKERTDMRYLATLLEPEIKFTKNDSFIINMNTAVTLRTNRLLALKSSEPLDIEFEAQHASTKEKQHDVFYKAIEKLERIKRTIEERKLLEDHEKYPAQSMKEKEKFCLDLLYQKAKDEYVLINTYHDVEYLQAVAADVRANLDREIEEEDNHSIISSESGYSAIIYSDDVTNTAHVETETKNSYNSTREDTSQEDESDDDASTLSSTNRSSTASLNYFNEKNPDGHQGEIKLNKIKSHDSNETDHEENDGISIISSGKNTYRYSG